MDSKQLLTEVIRPTCEYLDMWSEAAGQLLLGTCAVESNMGQYLRQLNDGPARGIFQIEPNTHMDLWENWINRKPKLADKLSALVSSHEWSTPTYRPKASALVTNLAYATAIARLIYYRRPEPLPEAGDWEGLARYWEAHYNCVRGQGTLDEEGFIRAVKLHLGV